MPNFTQQSNPNPALVSQLAVRRLPRVWLWLLCLGYVLPGWFGREPWKSADMAAFGYMQALADGRSAWLTPSLFGLPTEQPGLLPLWLGAAAIRLFGGFLSPDFAARIPFALLLGLSFACTWYACFYLARRASAQPVRFAFGGDAAPTDYARAVADGALLALIASLGLAQLSHQTTIDLGQLAAASAMFCGFAALPRKPLAGVAVVLASAALAASGAPATALVLAALGGASQLQVLRKAFAGQVLQRAEHERLQLRAPLPANPSKPVHAVLAGGLAALAALVVGMALDQFRLTFALPSQWRELRDLGRLWVWFAWPGALLAAWTLWRWRKHLWAEHLSLPVCVAGVGAISSAIAHNSDRALMLALPAVSVLAAFALPTVKRSVAAAVDWFTLLFFSVCALVIWVVWLAMHTGIPAQPAANVVRLAPGFVPQFSLAALAIAAAATGAWLMVVRWRVGRNPHPMWKSLVLPASGAALCWLLLMTLWLPLLDFARSYAPLMQKLQSSLTQSGCVHTIGFTRAQLAALQWYTQRTVQPFSNPSCTYLLVDRDAANRPDTLAHTALPASPWQAVVTLRRPADDDEDLVVYQRRP